MKAIYESLESFPIRMEPSAAVDVLKVDLRASGYKPRDEGNGITVTVHTGSNFLLRLWDTSLSWGRNNVPVGMTVAFDETTKGSTAKVRVYDMLGWYLDARTNRVLKRECQRRTTILTELARRSLNLTV